MINGRFSYTRVKAKQSLSLKMIRRNDVLGSVFISNIRLSLFFDVVLRLVEAMNSKESF